MNSDLARLQPYPFERLAALLRGVPAPSALTPINLSIGEPKHPTPPFILQELSANLSKLAAYPTTKGTLALRLAAAQWLMQRFGLPADSVDPERHVLPVNGTREALFAFAQCAIDRHHSPAVLMPNPFYQIYEGAALLAGAEPVYLNSLPAHGFVPDYAAVSAQTWARCRMLYLCSPDNPTGAVTSQAVLQQLLHLAEEYNFIIAADECYCDIYAHEDRPPAGLLSAAAAMGNTDWRRCIVFHSLSKRSNVPGLRSGFVAGDADLLKLFLLYRTYHGSAMSPTAQAASAKAWSDTAHAAINRAQYREKFAAVLPILAPAFDVALPAAAFYLWPRTPVDELIFTRELYAKTHVTVLPGSFLSRPAHGIDPGAQRVRVALVATPAECVEAATRMREFAATL